MEVTYLAMESKKYQSNGKSMEETRLVCTFWKWKYQPIRLSKQKACFVWNRNTFLTPRLS